MRNIITTIVTSLICVACCVLGLVNGINLSILQQETLYILFIVCGCSVIYCFIVGEISRNNSQMDKLWSILPIAYTWIVAIKGGMSARLIVMAVISSLWGIRLTYNFAKKGAYKLKFWTGEEDYRWIYLRKQKPFNNKIIWGIFDLLFISFYQNFLVLLTTIPCLAVMDSAVEFNFIDVIASILMLGFLILEIVSDRQQNKFQTTKYKMLNEGKKLNELPDPYNKGFKTDGLFARSRHPNYLGEQGVWFSLYLFTLAGKVPGLFVVFNYSIIGSMLLILLFLGSSTLSESISLRKYPLYKTYVQQVNKYLPFRKYQG